MAKIEDFFKLKDAEPHHHHIRFLIFGGILLTVALILLIKPAFTGYAITNQFEKLDLSASEILDRQNEVDVENKALNTRLESSDDIIEEFKERNKIELNEKNECLTEKSGLEFQLSKNQEECATNSKTISDELNFQKLKNNELINDFNELGDNSANNICCKLRIDDNNIDSYSIKNNKVICGVDESIALSC